MVFMIWWGWGLFSCCLLCFFGVLLDKSEWLPNNCREELSWFFNQRIRYSYVLLLTSRCFLQVFPYWLDSQLCHTKSKRIDAVVGERERTSDFSVFQGFWAKREVRSFLIGIASVSLPEIDSSSLSLHNCLSLIDRALTLARQMAICRCWT